MARKCVKTHISGANATCPVCGGGFTPKRRWQTFCSSQCRKVNWAASKRTGAYIDVRQVLAGIRADLDAVMNHLGVERGKS